MGVARTDAVSAWPVRIWPGLRWPGLSWIGLALATIAVVYFTTWPWTDFKGHSHWTRVEWVPLTDPRNTWANFTGNILLFVPFGAFVTPSTASTRVSLLTSALAGAALSLAIEFFQVYCHNHFPGATDVLANMLGSAAGTAAIRQIWPSLVRARATFSSE